MRELLRERAARIAIAVTEHERSAHAHVALACLRSDAEHAPALRTELLERRLRVEDADVVHVLGRGIGATELHDAGEQLVPTAPARLDRLRPLEGLLTDGHLDARDGVHLVERVLVHLHVGHVGRALRTGVVERDGNELHAKDLRARLGAERHCRSVGGERDHLGGAVELPRRDAERICRVGLDRFRGDVEVERGLERVVVELVDDALAAVTQDEVGLAGRLQDELALDGGARDGDRLHEHADDRGAVRDDGRVELRGRSAFLDELRLHRLVDGDVVDHDLRGERGLSDGRGSRPAGLRGRAFVGRAASPGSEDESDNGGVEESLHAHLPPRPPVTSPPATGGALF